MPGAGQEAATEQLPLDLADARKRINAAIIARQGAGAFRKAALKAFGSRCAVTGCDVEGVLEAAHVVPYLGTATNLVTNTFLLRADIHTLFDRGLLSVSPETLRIELAGSLQSSFYGSLHGREVVLPAGDDAPWRSALRQRKVLMGF
jgi:putative restriction endonuclease